MFLLGNAIRSHFFLSNAGVPIFFFNGTVLCCKRPFYFVLSFIFLQSFKYFLYFFSLVYFCLSEEKIVLLFPVYYLAVFMDKYSLCFLYLILK